MKPGISYIIIVHLFAAQPVVSQSAFTEKNFYNLTLSIGKSEYAAALSWVHQKGLGNKKQRFSIGYGLRFTSYTGRNQDFITAPARLTSRQEGPQVLFSKTYPESLDTIRFASSQLNALNMMIHFEYSLVDNLGIGFNIDAAGFSFGRRQKGKLKSSIKPSALAEEQSAKPTPFNLLLVSDNDIGSLNSEMYFRYWIGDHVAIKAGFCFLFAEYTTDAKLIFDNDRFRNKAGMGMIGVTYNPFRKIK